MSGDPNELTMENVQRVLNEDIRPALQDDGGDIELVKIVSNDIFVTLTGACSTCAMSTVTIRHGVEALLREQFPQLGCLWEI